MAKRVNARAFDKPVSLLVLEGDTEQVFYPLIRDQFLKGIRIELRNIKGRGNVNKDILSEMGLSLGMKLDGFVPPTQPPKPADSDVDEGRIMNDKKRAEEFDEVSDDIED